MLMKDQAVLIVIDVQDRLASLMHEKEALFDHLRRLLKGVRVLGLPIIWLEQYPEGLGPTVPGIAELLAPLTPISKTCFSCCASDEFLQALKASGRKQVLLCGIETHVCVYQTARDLLDLGFEVEVVADAVSSRTAENRRLALERIRDAGGRVTSTEMALFELLGEAKGETFRQILKIVK